MTTDGRAGPCVACGEEAPSTPWGDRERRARRVRCAQCRSLVHPWCREDDGRCELCSGSTVREVQLWCRDPFAAAAITHYFVPRMRGLNRIRQVHMLVVVVYRDGRVPRDVVRHALDNGFCSRDQAAAMIKELA